MSPNPNIEERYPSYINRDKILEQFRSNANMSRSILLSDYDSGYGNLTGFALSYRDALEGRNISDWPFRGEKDPFVEDERFSILPNPVSRRAANVWNQEGKVIALPPSRDDGDKEVIGVKRNTGVYPLNISGVLRGEFSKANQSSFPLTPIPMPLPHYLAKLYEYRLDERLGHGKDPQVFPGDDEDEMFGYDDINNYPMPPNIKRIGNITTSEGTIKLSFYNSDAQMSPSTNIELNGTTPLSLSLTMNDFSQNDEHSMSLSGIYHQDTGNIVVSTKSGKFGGIYAIPQLNLASGLHYDKSKWAFFNELNQTKVDDIKFNAIEQLVDGSDECEYIGYFHIESTNLTKDELQQIDSELESPVGRPHKSVPPLKMSSGILYSPNCAIFLDLNESKGVREEIFDDSLRNVILVASVVVFAQILLLIRQLGHTTTPSTLSKLSFWTISIINMADSSLAIITLLCSMIFTELYIQFAVCAFLAFTCSAIYEIRYGIKIYCTQMNERSLDWRTMLQGTPIDERTERREEANAVNNNANGVGGNTTADNTNTIETTTPTNVAGTSDEHSVGAELYTRHFFTILVFLFVLLNVITWPKTQRNVFECLFLIIFNSYWVPQIYRNVLRGSRTSFTWEFILGTSIVRLIPVIYVEIFPNPFNHHRNLGLSIFLVLWISLQITVMYLQELLGARFFVNDTYLPQAYDYHPILTKGDIESGFGLGVEDLVGERASSSDDDSRELKYVTDCAICMQKLEIPVFENASTAPYVDTETSLLSSSSGIGFGKSANSLLARRKYMVTPCHHVFHTDCLENWMMYKLQCPVCRHSLPPC